MFFFSSRRRHTRCALVTGVQTCALPICPGHSTIHSEFSANRTLSARSSLPSCVLMAIRIPNTMTGLVAAACVLAALPLMIALLLAEVALERVTKQTELLIDDGVAVSQLSNEMRDELQDLERASKSEEHTS